MAVSITLSQVKELAVANAVPDAVLTGFIAQTNRADNCFDSNSVDNDIQTALKLNAVWHLVELFNRASVSSESSPTGASRSYKDGEGFQSTPYGQVVQSLDTYNCMQNALVAPGRTMLFRSSGRNNVPSRRQIPNQ